MSIPRDRIDAIFDEIKKYHIELAADPTVLGAKYLQDLIATCRNYTNHVARILNELHREKMDLDFDLRRKETAFRIAADELLAQNPMVRNLPNIADRQGQINVMLRDEHREIERLKNDVKDLEHIEKAVRMVHRELKDVMGEIKVQRSLIRDEIDTGRMYGDERNSDVSGARSPGAKPDDIDEDEIERMLRGEIAIGDSEAVVTEETDSPQSDIANTAEVVEEVLVEPAAESPAPAIEQAVAAPPARPSTEEEQIVAFLTAPASSVPPAAKPDPTAAKPAPSAVVSDQDFSDLFDTI